MSVVTNIKAMSSGIGDLNKQVKELLGNVKSLAGVTAQSLGGVKGMLMGGGARGIGFGQQGNVMGGSLASFSTPQMAVASMAVQGAGNMIQGAAQLAMAPVAMSYGATMDSSGIVNRASSYYQTTLRTGGGNRSAIANATFSALKGGLTGIGSDAQVAAVLAGRGYTAGTSNYLGAVAEVGGAARYLGMGNQQAASAIAGMQSGGFAANAYQYGITTMNADGSFKSTSDISKQIMNTFAPNIKGVSIQTGKKITAQDINTSLLKGNLGPILQGLGLSSDQQQMVVQSMIDSVSGKNPNLASKNTSSGGAGNLNPQTAAQRMNTSQTMIQQASEKNTIRGLDAAATTTEIFNNNMKDVITSMAIFKGYLDGMSGTNAGKGIKAGAHSAFSGIKNFLGGALKVAGAVALGALMVGGGNPGYGGSFTRKGARGGGNPGAPVAGLQTAGYGAVDTSGIWSSTNNQHKGVDYAAPVGTPVYTQMEGIVSGDALSADYGNAILIDHSNGYSSLYAHLSNKEVSPGTQVTKGQEIGKVGQSGNTTGPGLHYEIRRGKNNPVDPSELGGLTSPFSAVTTPRASGGFGSVPNNTNVGTDAQKSFASQVLSKLGAPTNDTNINNILGWIKWEGGTNHNNPLNTTYKMTGATDWNSTGVKTYASMQDGVTATVSTLTGQDSAGRGYDSIVNALKSGSTPYGDFAGLVNKSKWGTNIKGGGTPGYGASVHSPVSKDPILGSVSVTQGSSESKNVYITVKIDQANEANAISFAKKVQHILDNKNNNHMIGSS
jgi:murein DD-endopeptidase MepM/ murein hydrolase activator NlpD